MGIAAGLAAAAVVGAAASAGGSAAAAGAKGKAAKKMQKEADRNYARDQARIFAAREGGQADAQRTAGNLMAGEQARAILTSQMGRPGSYDDFASAGPIGLGNLTPQGVGGLGGAAPTLGVWDSQKGEFGTKDVKGPKGGPGKYTFDAQQWESEGFNLDPEAIAASAMDSQSFKNISRMTAEAGEMLAGRGELYNKLTQSIVGGTFGATAARARQVDEEMAREVSRSGGEGAARAMRFAARAQAQEEVNRTHVNAMWSSKLQMEGWARNYAGAVQNMGQMWVDNAAGVRDIFNNALNNAQNFWTNVMIPTLMPQSQEAANKQAQSTQQAQQLALDAKLQKISTISTSISSLANIAGGMMGGGTSGSLGSITSLMGASGMTAGQSASALRGQPTATPNWVNPDTGMTMRAGGAGM